MNNYKEFTNLSTVFHLNDGVILLYYLQTYIKWYLKTPPRSVVEGNAINA